ncbi:hypothetical protein J4437_05545 [Candidatus Woesearchaeota archaeon]|nr:hypothetical protein [Candidatus Woesearchaeota archaeon]
MKKGQAAGAAVLVAIIAALLIGFIVMISPEERADILGEPLPTASDSDTVSGTTSDNNLAQATVTSNVLRKSPGRIDYLEQNEVEHPLPVVNIFTKTETEVIAEKSSAYAKKSLFSEEPDTFRFSLQDWERAENILFAFDVREASGRIKINLNKENIFNGELKSGAVPLRLPKSLLKADNELTFTLTSPGIAFWATNILALENLKIVADVTDVEAQSSTQVFLVSETERNNLEKVTLRFQPDCLYNEVGPLQIVLNGQKIYDAVPDCDLAFVPIEISSGMINKGENQIQFKTERGVYLLSHVLILSQLQEVQFPTYYFELSYDQFREIKDNKAKMRAKVEFVDSTNTKTGYLEYNGFKEHFDTRQVTLTLDLSEDAVQGTNALKIVPRRTLEIREIRMDLVR